MTLKYESEILFDLMKRDGDDAPSDVLPYESELKEKYLQQVEGAYPKLQDYRPEWLNYNLVAHLPADFPVETLSNVTSATVDNVVPYAYGSAILKGNTLVNFIDQSKSSARYMSSSPITNGYRYQQSTDVSISYQSTRIEWNTPNELQLKASTKYILKLKVKTGTQERKLQIKNQDSTLSGDTLLLSPNTLHDVTCEVITTQDYTISPTYLYFRPSDWENCANDVFDVYDLLLIEYQEGIENWDIPYFEGMASVKMGDVVTGKNLFDGELVDGYIDSTTGNVNSWSSHFRTKNYIKIIPNTKYVLNKTTDFGENALALFFYDINKNFINANQVYYPYSSCTSPQNAEYVLISGAKSSMSLEKIKSLLQLEEGTVATEYEPYKTYKMPVLTTTGKNLFDLSDNDKLCIYAGGIVRNEDHTQIYQISGSTINVINQGVNLEQLGYKLPIKKNIEYLVISGEGMNGVLYYRYFGKDFTSLKGQDQRNIAYSTDSFGKKYVVIEGSEFPAGAEYIFLGIGNGFLSNYTMKNIQIEEGTQATPYEPYQSILLTVNEDVTLRGIGDVQDTLDCLTGEVVERVGEYEINDTTPMGSFNNTDEKTIYFHVNQTYLLSMPEVNAPLISNSVIQPILKDLSTLDVEGVHFTSKGHLQVRIDKSRLSGTSSSDVLNYLRENPITVQYQLKTESIKTVDLTVTEQDGNTTSIIRPIEGTMHLMTEGDTIKPLFSGEVPVEATTQNLASFIEEE